MLCNSNPSIIGGIISVDYFKKNPLLKYRFLTHAHSSCCEDIPSGFTYPIYCSAETAAVLPILLRKSKSDFYLNDFLLRPLARNVRYYFDDFTVILLEANHVPGGVILIFDNLAQVSGPVLYAGHFRADSSFYLNSYTVSILKQYDFDVVFLGVTYAEAKIKEFPSKESSEHIQLYKFSKEIADVLLPGNRFNDGGSETRIFTIDRECAMKKLADLNTEQCESNVTNRDEKKRDQNADNVYFLEMNVCMHEISQSGLIINDPRVTYHDYADQSSFNELRDFLSILSYQRLVGIEKLLTANLINKLTVLKTNSTAEKSDNHQISLTNFSHCPELAGFEENEKQYV
uniref:Lactamase_B domain-containing protein n=1 Tax=Syphacia muris TaxID=451379 RepID=A0A0N5AU19_9BILA